MSFLKGLMLAVAVCAAIPTGALAQTAQQPAGAAARAPKPSPATEQGPTAVEKLNKSLNPGASSDPDVPLPHPNLANVGPGAPSRAGTQVYGRQEEGGGVLGLRMQIPVDRGSAAQASKPTP